MKDEVPLLKQTLRITALMVVPVVALLAILTAVALFAVPSSSRSPKEQRVILQGETSGSPDTAQPRTRGRDGT